MLVLNRSVHGFRAMWDCPLNLFDSDFSLSAKSTISDCIARSRCPISFAFAAYDVLGWCDFSIVAYHVFDVLETLARGEFPPHPPLPFGGYVPFPLVGHCRLASVFSDYLTFRSRRQSEFRVRLGLLLLRILCLFLGVLAIGSPLVFCPRGSYRSVEIRFWRLSWVVGPAFCRD